MLRYYDGVGLMRPVKVDQFTGYRYYHEQQLLAIEKISALRDMGFGVAAIAELLSRESETDEVYAALAAWISANGYELCGPMMDIYYVSPNETRNPDEFITEVCCPVKKV